MHTIQIDDIKMPPGECGTWAFMYRGKATHLAEEHFQREDLAFKIHHQPMQDTLDNYTWGAYYLAEHERSPLLESLAIQNICALHGHAPRVFGVWLWEDEYGHVRPAQITEDMGRSDWSLSGKEARIAFDQIKELGQEMGFTTSGDKQPHNFASGKYVDFQAFRFTEDYHTRLYDRFWQGSTWGDRPYQSVGASTKRVSRNTAERIVDLGLLELDFRPRRILDIGCSGGMFLNELVKHYRARGYGYDTKRAMLPTAEMSIVMNNWNTDYAHADLRANNAIAGDYDLVLFLNMSKHVGFPHYVTNVASHRLIVEVHSEDEALARERLTDEFEIIREHRSSDYGRLVLHANRRV